MELLMADFSALKIKLGLTGAELASLLGIPRDSGIINPRNTIYPGCRSVNNIVCWFMSEDTEHFVSRLLDYWTIGKPRNAEDTMRLIRVARRYKRAGPEFVRWETKLRSAHPEFFGNKAVSKSKKVKSVSVTES